MIENNNLLENPDIVKENLEYKKQLEQIRKEVVLKFQNYNKTLLYMTGDAPLGILCLPPIIEKCLLDHGCLRVYDLFNVDFTKVKGLGIARIRDLTSRLDEFCSMI